MKLAFVLLFLFVATDGACQSLQKVRQLLKGRELSALDTYINKEAEKDVSQGWERLREVVGEYKEGVVQMYVDIPYDSIQQTNSKKYEVSLLSFQNKIFYYKIVGVNNIKTDTNTCVTYGDTLDLYEDAGEYLKFKSYYQQVYRDTLPVYDLFLTSFVYGSDCGIAGVDPPGMMALSSFLRDRDTASMRCWLRSPNAEKQLYAIRGYRSLMKFNDFQLSAFDKSLLALVKQKNVAVNTCSGCTYWDRNFQEVVADIEAMPAHLLMPEGKPHETKFKMASRYAAARYGLWIWAGIGAIFVSLIAFIYFKEKRKGN